MTKYALARPDHGQPRFFTGRYVAGESLSLMSPVTSRQPDEAKTWDDETVVKAVQAFLNVVAACRTGEPAAPWIVMPLPEAWT